jgi:hypothetical protein
LQDGSTYYLQARVYDPAINAYSNWSTAVPFKIDMRTGKDKTQTFDTLGPVSADLATGNLMTSASSHTSAALGGSLGVSLDYNSPVPGQQRRGRHHEDFGPAPAGYEPGQRGEPHSVGRLVPYPAGVAAQHRVLVPEHQQFSVLRQVFTECQDRQAGYPAN